MAVPNSGRRVGEFYHGTTNDIEGGVIRPGRDAGYSNWGNTGTWYNQTSERLAFATSDEKMAWQFAEDANAKQSIDYDNGVLAKHPDRTRVYTVKPNSKMKPGHYTGFREFVAPSFEVKDRIDTMPGRQGTIPTVNWRQFQAYPFYAGPDPNHPTNEEVAAGMDPWEPGRSLKKPNRNQVSPDQLDLFTGRTAAEHAEAYDYKHVSPKEHNAVSLYHDQRMDPYER